MNDLLNSLSIKKNNFGSCSGPDGWIEKTDTKIIESYNPSNGERIASVYEATLDEYNIIIKKFVEKAGKLDVSSAENMLNEL